MRDGERMSIAEYKAAKSPKYRNKRTVVDGRALDSKLEAARYQELKKLQAVGAVKWFITQAPFRLPGGIIYRADFLVVWLHGLDPMNRPTHHEPVTVEDCKGARTRVSINKIKQVEEIYGIKVHIITKRSGHA